MSHIEGRRELAKERTIDLVGKLRKAEALIKGKACVYATGSFGRLEASSHSDLDLFIVGERQVEPDSGQQSPKSKLSRLDEILVKAELVQATRELKFPDFDGDGKYLVHYCIHDLIRNLGKPEDDAENTLTGRLLLFLESKPLIGRDVYGRIIEEVVTAYWRDYSDHKDSFIPAYLVNDILRLWRTFCVNYEARTASVPQQEKIKRKIKNFKLKHSRMLTCYSALLYLLQKYKMNNTVSPEDAIVMTGHTPLERLEFINKKLDGGLENLILQYDKFLEITSYESGELYEMFSDNKKGAELMRESYKFGDLMHDALLRVGGESKLMRLIVV